MIVYFSKNLNEETVKKSSSGGFFSLLAKYVIDKNGIVFGATFDKDFNVEITYTEKDFSGMLGSKYVKSSVKKSFAECKEFLEKGRTVLYSGTPCQIIGLKAYLKKDYSNLITMDVICHGSPIAEIWQHYLKSFNKEIAAVNFRDKRESWERFHLTIKFKDGTEFSENHRINKYMKLFLENKILTEPCYKCQNCKKSKADFTVGDAWAAQFKDCRFNDHQGASCVILRTAKSSAIFDKLKTKMLYEPVNEIYLNKSVGYVHDYIKPADSESIKKAIISPKLAIVTIPGHENIGNTLQAFALQSKIKDILPKSEPIVINQKDTSHLLEFYKNKVKYSTEGFNSSYDGIIVGSDQIWIPYVWPGIPFEDQFLIRNTNKKIVYAASFGKHTVKFTDVQKQKVHDSLINVKHIGVRELSGEWLCKKLFNIDNAIGVLDPTMLYDKDFYLNSIDEKEIANKNGIFVYVLDKNETWDNKIKEISDKLGQPILPYNSSVEDFIHNMNAASCILTDSYHGTVFSLIFNRPFITLRNMKRGNDRFDDLSIRFNIDNRFIYELDKMDLKLLFNQPNILKEMNKQRIKSLEFLNKALMEI